MCRVIIISVASLHQSYEIIPSFHEPSQTFMHSSIRASCPFQVFMFHVDIIPVTWTYTYNIYIYTYTRVYIYTYIYRRIPYTVDYTYIHIVFVNHILNYFM